MMGSDMDRFTVLSRTRSDPADARGGTPGYCGRTGCGPLTPAFESGRSSIEARGSPEAISRATTEDRAERCAGSLLVMVSCSVVRFDPSGRGVRAMGHADMGGAAAPRGQPLRDVNGAGRDAR